jgi:hypothetical protein
MTPSRGFYYVKFYDAATAARIMLFQTVDYPSQTIAS